MKINFPMPPLLIIMKRILLTEDDSFIIDIYSRRLMEEGYKVDVARDGQTAFEKIKNSYPDLLILDINLPQINGCELLKMIRKDPKTKSLKVIVISNLEPKDYPEDISNLGIIKYFLKIEVTPEELIKNINEILK